ncbi:MAG: hypothetical protein KC422_13990 [Trueperaceae bacterium]|nr:hypothetical protein [Trueperaceae bacterium]
MAKVRNLILVGIIALFLGACSLIPPINVGDDPFGVTGKEVTATVGSSSALTVLTKTANGSVSGSFDNVDPGGAPTPASILAKINIQNAVTVSAADGVYPNTLTLEITVNGSVSDTSGTASASGKISNVGLTKDPNCADASASCVYTVTADPTAAEVNFTGNAMTIVFAGSQPNTFKVEIAMSVTGSPADLADGSTITVKLEGAGATAKL